MRKVFSLLAFIVLLNSCQESPDYALLSGNVVNPRTEIITILDGREKLQEIVIKEDGSFADTLKVGPGYYRLAHGNESSTMYIAPGYDLYLELNTSEFDESLKYSGDGSEVNNYLAAKYLANEKSVGDIPTHYSLEEKAYSEKVLAMKNENLKSLEEAGVIDENFQSLETRNLEYEYVGLLTRYETYHKYYTKQDDFEASEDFLSDDIEQMVFDDVEAYENIPSYKSLANNLVSTRIFNAIGEDYQSASVDHFKALDAVEIPQLKKDVISTQGVFLISPANPNMKALYEYFISNLDDEELKQSLSTKFDKNKSLLRGMPSPVFVDYENHKGGTTSLEDLKGKYVYIDVWAT
ncbi:MAG: TlpA family protein disulfide reductase, partial [Flavobacteriaceae bacterium]|nr:TlpA family protein disulfide reductase [Flavobacteriaceae bacterium]